MNIESIIMELEQERDRIGQAISLLKGNRSSAGSGKAAVADGRSSGGRRGRMSPAARKRLSELMKKRWAERRKAKRA
jgi:hypothetical protein